MGTLMAIKDGEKHSFFKRLVNPKNEVDDNVGDFQMISMAFLLFVKAFTCYTGNCLENGNHILKRPKNKHFTTRKRPIIDTLLVLKAATLKEEKKTTPDNVKVQIDDLDCDFHNDNMPLQFDL